MVLSRTMYGAKALAAEKEEETELVRDKRDVEKDKALLKGHPEDATFSVLLLAMYGDPDLKFNAETTKFLDGFEVMDSQTDIGGILVRFKEDRRYGLEVDPGGVDVVGMTEDELLSDKGLEAIIEAAYLAKTMPDAEENGIYSYHKNHEVNLVLNKAAELVGLKVINDDAVQGDLSPEMLKRLETAWGKVLAKHELITDASVSAPGQIAALTTAASTAPAATANQQSQQSITAGSAHPPMADVSPYTAPVDDMSITPSFLSNDQSLAGHFNSPVNYVSLDATNPAQTQEPNKPDTAPNSTDLSAEQLDAIVKSIGPDGIKTENVTPAVSVPLAGP